MKACKLSATETQANSEIEETVKPDSSAELSLNSIDKKVVADKLVEEISQLLGHW